MIKTPAAALAALLAVLAQPAAAQKTDGWETDGWEIIEAEGALIASASYESGQSFVVRCRDGKLDVLMTGVPVEADALSRWLEWTAASGVTQRQTWLSLPGRPVAFAARPVHVARILRKGGTPSIRLLATKATPQTRRYDLPLPSDGSGVDRVLAACNVRLDHPRDDLIEINPPIETPGVFPNIWGRMATPNYPNRGTAAGTGEVLFSCVVTATGALQDCRIERETPLDHDFGKETLVALRSSRLRLGPGVEPGRLIISRIRFRLD
jgi:hypothetical protein